MIFLRRWYVFLRIFYFEFGFVVTQQQCDRVTKFLPPSAVMSVSIYIVYLSHLLHLIALWRGSVPVFLNGTKIFKGRQSLKDRVIVSSLACILVYIGEKYFF